VLFFMPEAQKKTGWSLIDPKQPSATALSRRGIGAPGRMVESVVRIGGTACHLRYRWLGQRATVPVAGNMSDPRQTQRLACDST